jgi:hypothetical protein
MPLSSGIPGVTFTPGDHICAFYRGAAQRNDILVPFLREAIRAGNKGICVMDDPDTEGIVRPLSEEVDLELSRRTGQLDLLCSKAAYLAGDYFDVQEMIDFWDERIGKAVKRDGFEFVRSVGEMTWALRDLPGVELLLTYEAKLNEFLPRYPQVILCLYDLEQFTDAEVLLDLLRTHPLILLSGQLVDNPWYCEPDEYLATRR